MKIEGGTGAGYTTGVTEDNQLKTQATMTTVEHWTNHDKQNAYQAQFSMYTGTTVADCCIFYIKNGEPEDIVIESATVYVNQATEIYFKVRDAGTVGGASTVTAVNVNAGSGKSIDDTTIRWGKRLTGLSGGDEFQRLKYTAATLSTNFNFEMDVIVPKNSVFTAYAATSGDSVVMTIPFFLKDAPI